MAINTRRKRQNVAQIGCPLPVSILPSAIDGFARAQIAWTYGGISIAPPPTGSAIDDQICAGSQTTITVREVTIGDWN